MNMPDFSPVPEYPEPQSFQTPWPLIRVLIASVLFLLSMVTAVCTGSGSSNPGRDRSVMGWEIALGNIHRWPNQVAEGTFNPQQLSFSGPRTGFIT